MQKKFLLFVMLIVACSMHALAGISDIPKTVNYRDARITDVGVVAADIYQWAVVDSITHKVDTVYTAEQYILWESNGDGKVDIADVNMLINVILDLEEAVNCKASPDIDRNGEVDIVDMNMLINVILRENNE